MHHPLIKTVRPVLSLVLILILSFAASHSAAGSLEGHVLEDKNAQWQITARKMSYNEKESLYIAEGDVAITRNGQVLSARKAVYNEKTGIVQVSGDVRLQTNGDILTGEMGIFDLNSQNGQITRGELFMKENNFHVSGSAMMRTGPNTYLVRECRLTTCEGERPAWSVTGSEVKVTLEGYGTVRNAAFRIHNFPIFYLPYAIFPVKSKRQTGFLPPRVGYSDRNGLDVEIPFFWALSDQTDATLYERFMSERGLMHGIEFRYVAEEQSKGLFQFDVLSDRIEDKDMGNPEEVDLSPFERTNGTRYWLRSRADQQLPAGVRARLDTDFVSDQDYLKEFRGGLFGYKTREDLEEASGRPLEDINSPTRRSALRLSRDGEDYSLQASASYHQRPENPSEDDTPQPLAGLNLSFLPRPLGTSPLFVGLEGNHDYVWRETGPKGQSSYISPSITYPLRLGHYVELEPSLRLYADTQWIDDPGSETDRQTRKAYEAETRLSTFVERIFDFQWKDIRRLKHKVVPSLTYTFRGYDDQDRYRPWFESIDEEGGENTVTLSLENLLDARKEDGEGNVTYAQWGTFTLSQGYDVDEARREEEPWRKKQPFLPLSGILTLRPLPNLDFQAEARWDHEEDRVSFADLSLDLTVDRRGGKKDSFSIDYQYAKGEDNFLGYRVSVNLVHGFSAGSSQKRDFDRGQTMEHIYWIDYESQCWGVRLIAGELDDVSSIMITFRLLGLGEI